MTRVPVALLPFLPVTEPVFTTQPLVPNLRRYKRVVNELRQSRVRCESCWATAEQVKQKKLYAHHIQPISDIMGGLNSDLAVNPANLLLLCNYCHSLFHPRQRSYPWEEISARRGFLFRRSF